MNVKAVAHPNIALVKYWGKRDPERNLPAAGSLSLTLRGAKTTTTLATHANQDEVWLDGKLASGRERQRVLFLVDLIAGDDRPFVKVVSENDFPTAAGLASSASGFAALALAAAQAFGKDLSMAQLSAFARRGSGSAARSIFGGWVRMDRGERDDGADSVAYSIAPADHWDVKVVVALTAQGPKDVDSTRGMNLTAQTSPYFAPWIASVDEDLPLAQDAVLARDFESMTRIAERSCLRMHASAMGADPGVIYFHAATLEVIHRLRKARDQGLDAFFTVDAGPHVKVFCPRDSQADVQALLRGCPGVLDALVLEPGEGARIV